VLPYPTNFEIIFTHNLGSFDGYFIYKALSNYFTNNPEKVSTIIDNQNKFITIKINLDNNKNIKWLDSNRIFPLSLDDLCKMFKVDGKVSKYKLEYNSIDMFNNPILLEEFKTYAIQDSIALYNALLEAQNYYSNKYSIDITSILSASSLSLKILRQQFLKNDIPILTQTEDNYIRKGYYGGATDIYRCYVENAHYYDVNSLYPYAMKNLMPFKIIKFHNNLSNIKLNDFFGYCLVKVTTPKDIEYPLLPFKHDGKTIYPLGSWKAVYFSELLKEVVKHGYKVELISGYEFSKFDLFSEYVDHFYHIKRNSVKNSPERFISKLHLNTPYGIFGRRKDLIQTLNVETKNFKSYLLSRVVKSTIDINEKITTILIHNNLHPKIINELNSEFKTHFINNLTMVKSNVAIAGAVTSYAQIHMIKIKMLCVKLGIKIYYTDTDSIFTDKPLPDYLIGNDLGQFKDELNGLVIKQAYFLGIKNYAYTIEYPNKEIKEYSVWAGVKRNTISFSEIISLFKGDSITKEVKNVFHKSLRKLDISIKDNLKSINIIEFKILNNNQFIPIKIYNNTCIDYIIL
jgi:DNA polymerase type B, organellar and viral